ncbi:hypothetical protein SNR37_004170 [Agarivorans aestuarii]|uniref:GTP-binding protein n=1 Tax=Agarivorans aestuarii TaxID=1563703 RepID=A0ABU7G652_9ALTE|nr:hypothetical protein [Agarivorans aestuarii]MEE1674726.1 hypothetical protein [Agarivorans aestuarii]
MRSLLTACLLMLGLSSLSLAHASEPLAELESDSPQLNMQLQVEVVGIDKAAAQASQALRDIADSVNHLASNPELSPEQQQHFKQTLNAVEQLSQQLDSSLKQLPDTVAQSTKPIVNLADKLSSEVQFWVMIILVSLVIIIIVALLAIYFGVLAPTSRAVLSATGQLNQLASSLKTTAELVEKTSAQNQHLLERLTPAPQRFSQRQRSKITNK